MIMTSPYLVIQEVGEMEVLVQAVLAVVGVTEVELGG